MLLDHLPFNHLPRSATSNDTISCLQKGTANHTMRWPGASRQEQYEVRRAGPDVLTSNVVATGLLPRKRTASMAALGDSSEQRKKLRQNNFDDSDDDDGFFEPGSEDESDSTLNDGPDSREGSDDEDEDPVSPSEQFYAAKIHLAKRKNELSEEEDALNLLYSDLEAVRATFQPAKEAQQSVEQTERVLNAVKHLITAYGNDIPEDIQQVLNNASVAFAEATADVKIWETDLAKYRHDNEYINRQIWEKDNYIEELEKDIDAIEKETEELGRKAKAARILDRVNKLGTEGIERLGRLKMQALENLLGIP
ncbi:hypothetical protein FIE12Z_3878 [Fusarium flagelliforme]|uniref:Uncharacterized protein n=1 Tax=Fusarium flagelliforme TaxID=2675880 RepID=A0A395MV69_9HYPO|nr:hypothetical protein FIE12Z_3878 [Fusarium flagelliforme]